MENMRAQAQQVRRIAPAPLHALQLRSIKFNHALATWYSTLHAVCLAHESHLMVCTRTNDAAVGLRLGRDAGERGRAARVDLVDRAAQLD